MEKENSNQIEILKGIVLLYANTKPDPVENLREISKALLKPPFSTIEEQLRRGFTATGGQKYELSIENYGVNPEIVHWKIEFIIRMKELGIRKAKEIFSNVSKKDQFIAETMGILDDFPPNLRKHREWCDEAFYAVAYVGYGLACASYCPCTFDRCRALQEEGFISPGEDTNQVTWIKNHLNCLQCEHLYFVSILKNLSKGKIACLAAIVRGYSYTYTEGAEYSGNRTLLRKYIESSRYTNKSAFPSFLDGLPCNALVELLSCGGYENNIKLCPHCGKFFFAKDSKRKFCYEASCLREMEKAKKKRQRETDPVKYV